MIKGDIEIVLHKGEPYYLIDEKKFDRIITPKGTTLLDEYKKVKRENARLRKRYSRELQINKGW